MPGGLSPDVALGVHLSAIMSRHKYDADPTPAVEELRRIAGDRTEVLAQEAGTWAGFYVDEHTQALAAALLDLPGAAEWEPLGIRRRGYQWNGNQPPSA